MKEQREKIGLLFFLLLTIVFLIASSYYSRPRYVGDTAIFAQIVENIAHTGKAESNIFANTQDCIDRFICGMPVEERLADESAFEPPVEQSRNMLRFHNYLILYLLAPFCFFMSGFACVTIAQSVSLAFSLFFCILIMRNRKVPYPMIIVACILLTAHPGWSIPAVRGAFYPDRLFMGTGMYLAWACDRAPFNKYHFIVATILCMLVGERGALYAGMFILAYTIFYWKQTPQARKLRLAMGVVAVAYAGIVMKFFLENMFYSGIGNISSFFSWYLTVPENVQKVILFLLINFLFLIVAMVDWRAFIIGMASMIPNLLYNVGGAEKIGWSLHYHVFYFVFLMWAVTRGVSKLYFMADRRGVIRNLPYAATLVTAIIVSLLNPTDLDISFSTSNISNNFLVSCTKEIKEDYFLGGRATRKDFDIFIKENIPDGSTVSTVEAGMCALLHSKVRLFPIGIKNADFALCTYSKEEEGYSYSGSVVYGGAGNTEIFDEGVTRMLEEYGYDMQNPILFPQYGLALLKKGGLVGTDN